MHHVLITNALHPGVETTHTFGGITSTGLSYRLFDYSCFEEQYGKGIYQKMAACDNGTDLELRSLILRYLRNHTHDREAMLVVWAYREMGDREALDIITAHANNSIPQGIDSSRAMRSNHRDASSPSR